MHSCVSYGVSMFGIYVIQYKILTSAAAVKMCSSVVTRTVCLSTVGWPQAADNHGNREVRYWVGRRRNKEILEIPTCTG